MTLRLFINFPKIYKHFSSSDDDRGGAFSMLSDKSMMEQKYVKVSAMKAWMLTDIWNFSDLS